MFLEIKFYSEIVFVHNLDFVIFFFSSISLSLFLIIIFGLFYSPDNYSFIFNIILFFFFAFLIHFFSTNRTTRLFFIFILNSLLIFNQKYSHFSKNNKFFFITLSCKINYLWCTCYIIWNIKYIVNIGWLKINAFLWSFFACSTLDFCRKLHHFSHYQFFQN